MNFKKVYLFIFGGLIIFGGIVFAAGYRQGWFGTSNEYRVLFENGDGVFVGTPVSISGLRAGSVKGVELNNDNKVQVKISIQSKFAHHIREDSKAVLGRPFIIGERAISVTPGKADKKILAEYAYIAGEESLEITDMLSGGRMGSYFGTFSKLLEQIRIVVEGDGTKENVTLIELYKQAFVSLKSIENLSREVSGLKRDVTSVASSPEMKKIFYGVSNSTEDITQLLKETQKTLPSILKLSENLTHVMPQLSKTLSETVFTLQALQRSFILSGGVKSLRSDMKEAQEKGTPMPSAEDYLKMETEQRKPASETQQQD